MNFCFNKNLCKYLVQQTLIFVKQYLINICKKWSANKDLISVHVYMLMSRLISVIYVNKFNFIFLMQNDVKYFLNKNKKCYEYSECLCVFSVKSLFLYQEI